MFLNEFTAVLLIVIVTSKLDKKKKILDQFVDVEYSTNLTDQINNRKHELNILRQETPTANWFVKRLHSRPGKNLNYH